MKLRNISLILALLLISSGLFILHKSQSLYAWRQPASVANVNSNQATTHQPPQEAQPTQIRQVIDSNPQQIVIPDLSIDVKLLPGDYDHATGRWNISDETAFFASVTDPDNLSVGNNLFIYGHNSRNIFANLPFIQHDTKIYLNTSDGKSIEFSLIESRIVEPTEAGILDYDGTPRLILQTCTGLFNQQRFIAYFQPTDQT